MKSPKWRTKTNVSYEEKILCTYRFGNNNCNKEMIIMKNPKSTLSRAEQLEHVNKSIKITEDMWVHYYKEGKDGGPAACVINFEDNDGNMTDQQISLADALEAVVVQRQARGMEAIPTLRDLCVYLLKFDGYNVYVPISYHSNLKKAYADERDI